MTPGTDISSLKLLSVFCIVTRGNSEDCSIPVAPVRADFLWEQATRA
jgi:hypothetical protein